MASASVISCTISTRTAVIRANDRATTRGINICESELRFHVQ